MGNVRQSKGRVSDRPGATAQGARATLVASKHWYVVMTKPKLEEQARQQLERQGYDVYLPRHFAWRRLRGNWDCAVSPLFPRYLFIKEGFAGQSLGPVRSTLGVSGIVRFGALLATAPDDVVAALRDLEALRSQAPPGLESVLRPGVQVVFESGPFCGLEAVVEASAKDRVNLLLSLLGKTTRVSCSPAALRPVA